MSVMRVRRAIMSRLRRASSREPKKPSFQDKYLGHDQRWQLIEPHLPPEGSWIFDVGANLGRTVSQVAASGRYAIGLEVDERVHRRWLTESAPDVEGGAVIRAEFPQGHWERIPRCDAVLLFSVLHRIWALQGEESCWRALQGIGSRCDLIFVESATRRTRFAATERALGSASLGAAALPDFVDNDWESSAQWHLDFFARALPSHQAVLLGRVEHTVKEPFRPVFLLRRIMQG